MDINKERHDFENKIENEVDVVKMAQDDHSDRIKNLEREVRDLTNIVELQIQALDSLINTVSTMPNNSYAKSNLLFELLKACRKRGKLKKGVLVNDLLKELRSLKYKEEDSRTVVDIEELEFDVGAIEDYKKCFKENNGEYVGTYVCYNGFPIDTIMIKIKDDQISDVIVKEIHSLEVGDKLII